MAHTWVIDEGSRNDAELTSVDSGEYEFHHAGRGVYAGRQPPANEIPVTARFPPRAAAG